MKKWIMPALCLWILMHQAAEAAEFRFSPRPNRARLVQWREWRPEALHEARNGNKPILLSISAVWCHWCHVMDETTYSDDEVISYINLNFIPIRVDSDLRPDINALYNQGGWPSTAILTPEGEVISGGNYLPPGEMIERLKAAHALLRDEPNTLAERFEAIKTARELNRMRSSGLRSVPGRGELNSVEDLLSNAFDSVHGGFGSGQKFPNPDALAFLLSRLARKKDPQTKQIVLKTLDRMAQGGIHDRVDGGFFRYATKPDWSAPHYEKMLDVNAGMIMNYAEASLLFGKKNYLDVARNCLKYVRAMLYEPESGAFYGSQDADEGYYQAKNRKGLRKPMVDRTAYADSSSLMISALVSVHYATGQRSYLDTAIRCADFMLRNMMAGEKGMFHSFRDGKPALQGQLADIALFGSALLDLYNASGNRRYLQKALSLGGLMVNVHYNAKTMRFRDTLLEETIRPVTAGEFYELNSNLANYRALLLISRLLNYGDVPAWSKVRDDALLSISGAYRNYTPHAGSYGLMLLQAAGEPVRITIVAEQYRALKYLRAITRLYVPEKAVRILSPEADAEVINGLKYRVTEAAYLCAGKQCAPPVNDPSILRIELKQFLGKLPKE